MRGTSLALLGLCEKGVLQLLLRQCTVWGVGLEPQGQRLALARVAEQLLRPGRPPPRADCHTPTPTVLRMHLLSVPGPG